MKFSATLILAAAATSAHAHVKAHRSLQERDSEFVKSVRPTARDTPVTTTGTFCNGKSGTFAFGKGGLQACQAGVQSKRATAYDIAGCHGNLGAEGDYGCNIKEIEQGDVDSYKHVVTIENTSGQTQHCAAFLKLSKEGEPNGFFNGNQVLNVEIPAGSSQYIAVDEDSQGGIACGPGSDIPVHEGLFVGTWAEFDFSSVKNNGWSGADASCLTAVQTETPITPMSITSPNVANIVSSITAAGTGVNAFIGGTAAANGLGFNVPPGAFSLNVKLS